MNISSLIIGNLCSLFAMGTDSFSATRKTAKGVLLVQCLSQFFYGFGSIILKGYSGAVQNAMSVLRNVMAIKGIKSKALEWGIVVLGVILGLAFNNIGIWGLMPTIANLQYTLVVFKFPNDERALKISFMFSVILFIIFNAAILNLVGVVTNLIIFATTTISLIRDKKEAASK